MQSLKKIIAASILVGLGSASYTFLGCSSNDNATDCSKPQGTFLNDSGAPTSSCDSNIVLPPPGPWDGSFDLKKPFDNFPLGYHGGKVMTNPINVYLIWYGDWNNNSISIVEDFVSHIGNSDYFKINQEYYQVGDGLPSPYNPIDQDAGDTSSSKEEYVDDGGARTKASASVNFVKSFRLGIPRGDIILENDIPSIIKDTLDQNNILPDINGVYFVLTSKDVNEVSKDHPDYGFCSAYCGFHNQKTIYDMDVKYVFAGDPEKCPSYCSLKGKYTSFGFTHSPNNDWSADGIINAIVHELSESATDPDVNAWKDFMGYENADHCAWTFGKLYITNNISVANVKIGDRDYLIQQNIDLLSDGGQNCSLFHQE